MRLTGVWQLSLGHMAMVMVFGLGGMCPSAVASSSGEPSKTRLSWTRSAPKGVVTVTATPGPRMTEAEGTIQGLAARLDALRLFEAQVLWRTIEWSDGRLRVEAVASTAIYGNLALLVARSELPNAMTAGSGVQQIRGGGPFPWRVKFQAVTRVR